MHSIDALHATIEEFAAGLGGNKSLTRCQQRCDGTTPRTEHYGHPNGQRDCQEICTSTA